jgi:small GTP-binding protein
MVMNRVEFCSKMISLITIVVVNKLLVSTKMKIAFIGNSQSGKSSLFDLLEGVPFHKAYICTEDSRKTVIKKHEIWDCPGNEAFVPFRKSWLEGSERIFVFIDRSETVPDLSSWKSVIDDVCPYAEIVVILTKTDLNPKVHFYLPEWLINRFSIQTSAKKGSGLINLYDYI